MPPIRSKSSRNPTEQEERISLAIQAIKNQEASSIRELARRFDVPCTTLRNRLDGIQPRAISRANSHKLTETEEESLENWILSMDSRGGAPGPSMIREMANIVLEKRGTTPVLSVGKNWVTNFVKRRPLLSSRNSTPKAPFTEKDLRQQASSAEALLRTRCQSPPSSLDRALNQLLKGIRLTIQGAILLAKENQELRATIEKQKQKRTRSRRHIPAEAGLTVQEASVSIAEPVEAVEAPPSPTEKALATFTTTN